MTAGHDRMAVGPGRRTGVAVIGAGDHGRVVAGVLEAADVMIAGHYDDDPGSWGEAVGRSTVLGPIGAIDSGARAIIAVGDNAIRKRISESLDLDWISVIHPFSWVHPDVRLGPGTVVCAGGLVQAGAEVGAHVIVNNRAGIGHDAKVEDYAHITVAHVAGGARVGEGALVGIGSVVLPRVHVGAWATVGAGAVVVADVAPGTTVVGNPAKEMATRSDRNASRTREA